MPISPRQPPTTSKGAVAHDLYCQLRREVERAGCFRPTPWHHTWDAVLVISVYVFAYCVLLGNPDFALRTAALLSLAFASVRSGIMAHEAGHGSLTRNPRLARAYGHFFMTFLTALGFGHWQDIHRRHHPRCNDRARDPDMQSGLFSLYPESMSEKSGIGKIVTRYQAYMLWPLVSLQGFSLKVDSFKYMCRNPRATRADWMVKPVHCALWLGPPVYFIGIGDALINYGLMTWFIGPYLGTIFLFNHVGTRTIEPGEDISHLHRQISTSRNLGSSRLADFIFGGMNNHTEHHLFPSIPKGRLRRARRVTRDFCRRHGIHYREMGWWAACVELHQYLKDIADSAPVAVEPKACA